MAMLKMPVTGPLTAALFPTVSWYDPTPDEPSDWKLKIALESQAEITLQAVCSGILSTVPPDEVLGTEFKTIGINEMTRPSVSRFYLQPDPEVIAGLGNDLNTAHLGNGVMWFLYENVDTTALNETLIIALNNNEFLKAGLPDQQDREMAFLLGQASIHVSIGQHIGSASAANAQSQGSARFEFGVHTDFGYVDPVFFYNALQDHVEGDEGANPSALHALVGTDWPFVARDGNVNTLIEEAGSNLYPNAVLQEARQRLIWVAERQQWREIADAQKVQYLQRLYDNSLNLETNSTPLFQFNTDEMINPFQLEAVVEFFIFWKDPGVPGTLPLNEDFLALRQVNFGSPHDIQLVLIDAFNDDRLGNPALPKPDWAVDPWVQDGSKCDESGPDSPYPKDEYNGVLFLLYKGEIKGWYRWNSYSSHRWEDDSQGSNYPCIMASSIQGNLEYRFWSRTSPNRSALNHGLCAWYDGNDPAILAFRPDNVHRDVWTPGKFYFRAWTSDDCDGKTEVTFHVGTPDDCDGKTEVIFHFGLTKHDHVSDRAKKTNHQYNGSGGCIASPSYYLFRWDLCHWYFQQNPALDAEKRRLLEKIQNAKTHALAEKLYQSPEKQALMDAWGSDDTKANGYAIHGTFWLIHPDEPTLK